MKKICLLVLVMGLSVFSADDKNVLPRIISDGLKYLKSNKTDEAAQTWIKDSPNIGTKETNEIVKELNRAISTFGDYKGTRIADYEKITENYLIITVCLEFKKGCMFIKYHYYQNSDYQYLLQITINEDPEKILPVRIYQNSNTNTKN